MPARRATKAARLAPRRRRTAEEARRAILEAAQKRLAEGGPEAIRLQDIARDLGISHPTILHHFESREGLMQALAMSALHTLQSELEQAIRDPEGRDTPVSILDRVFETLGESGLARLLAWYALSHFTPDPEHQEQFMLRRIAGLLRRQLQQEKGDDEAPSREDAVFVVHLTAVALLGDAIFGHLINHSLGVTRNGASQRRFRASLAELLGHRLGLDTDD